MLDRFVPVAEICKPHGVTGELRLHVFHQPSSLLLARPPIRVQMPDGSSRELRFAGVRAVPKGLLARFVGVDDRDAAQALSGALLQVQRKHFPQLEPGEFYACDVEGARALLPDGSQVGAVLGLRSYPTCDALALRLGQGSDTEEVVEVPLVDAYVEGVDVEAGLVRLRTLEGLRDATPGGDAGEERAPRKPRAPRKARSVAKPAP